MRVNTLRNHVMPYQAGLLPRVPQDASVRGVTAKQAQTAGACKRRAAGQSSSGVEAQPSCFPYLSCANSPWLPTTCTRKSTRVISGYASATTNITHTQQLLRHQPAMNNPTALLQTAPSFESAATKPSCC
jgi:hypothetical protein